MGLQYLEGFEYLNIAIDNDRANNKNIFSTSVRMNIKLDKCKDINPISFTQNFPVSDNLAYADQIFTLTNYRLRECSIDFSNSRHVELDPCDRDVKVFIPLYVCKNESVNRALAK